jgi:serine/threonine protein kinase
MELVEGFDLFTYLEDIEYYSESHACEIIRPIIDATKYFHEVGIVHKDLKPENILYDTVLADAMVKIVDLGLD